MGPESETTERSPNSRQLKSHLQGMPIARAGDYRAFAALTPGAAADSVVMKCCSTCGIFGLVLCRLDVMRLPGKHSLHDPVAIVKEMKEGRSDMENDEGEQRPFGGLMEPVDGFDSSGIRA